MAREPRTETRRRERRQRRLLGGFEAQMTTTQRPGFVRRWVNDVPGRLAAFQEAGYEFVTEDGAADKNSDIGGSRQSINVGTNKDGSPMRAYLMEQREDYYREDQADKQATVDEIDAAMRRRGGIERNAGPDAGAFYVPNNAGEAVKIGRD